MRLALGADHRGNEATRRLVEHLRELGHEVEVLTDISAKCLDYPDSAWKVGEAVSSGKADRGVLLCGTGIGMCMAANKIKGVRAALVHDELTAGMSRSHNDANVLCISADLVGQRLIEKIVDRWLETPFEGGRHGRRVRKIAAIEAGEDPASVAE